jgi:hypothetical protein
MTLDEIREKIKGCAEEMNSRYGGVVFDEWVVVSLERNRARILHYAGPRNDEFLKNFVTDLGALRTALLDGKYGAGDFEFARHGIGTSHEAFLVLGPAYISSATTHANPWTPSPKTPAGSAPRFRS